MENASKALIIAGAILLSILLITLGIYVFSQAQTVTKENGFSKAEIQIFNSNLLKYEGEQTGSAVKSMITEVLASNASDSAAGNGRSITMKLGAQDLTKTSQIQSSAKYTVDMSYDTSAGYINSITVTKKQ